MIDKNKQLSDNEYWKQYSLNKDSDGFESQQNHEIELDIVCKFKNRDNEVIYEIKECDINCNLQALEIMFKNLKQTIRMLDETKIDKQDWCE